MRKEEEVVDGRNLPSFKAEEEEEEERPYSMRCIDSLPGSGVPTSSDELLLLNPVQRAKSTM